jgi:hypothetical protein
MAFLFSILLKEALSSTAPSNNFSFTFFRVFFEWTQVGELCSKSHSNVSDSRGCKHAHGPRGSKWQPWLISFGILSLSQKNMVASYSTIRNRKTLKVTLEDAVLKRSLAYSCGPT